MHIEVWLIIWLFVGSGFSQIDTGDEKRSSKLKYQKYSFSKQELNDYRREVRDLIYFAHDNYLRYAYPFDELRPISCLPKTRNFVDLDDVITNDVLGNFSVTLIDSLTTIAILGDKVRFKDAIDLIERTFPQKFDIDSTIQVFETTIRVVGGLISAHLYATDPSKKVFLGDSYNGILLELARDMADRLLPAYLTNTGLPLPRINLRSGCKAIENELLLENNVAAMASPMFEFTMLSYLTFDEKYAAVTRYAMNKTWSLRSSIGLLPMSFSPQTAQCYSPVTGIGASIDSFYEYALKGAILFDDEALYRIWKDSYRALVTYCKNDWFFINAQHFTGQLVVSWIDSLSAFFPGLQVLAGDVNDAIFKNIMSLKLWNTFGGIPERWSFQGNFSSLHKSPGDSSTYERTPEEIENIYRSLVPLEWYPLRPEFIESTYYLYRAEKDPFYLNIGVQILESFKTRFKHDCGFAGIQDVITGTPQDRMETFVLSESLKYLYLLFDEDNELHHTRDNIIFSTEAHPMWLKTGAIRKYSSNKFFNDTIYLTHLNKCHKKDKIATIKSNRIRDMRNTLTGFAKSLFADGNQQGANSTDNQTASNPVTYGTRDDICSISNSNVNPIKWSYSAILSQFNRLFEVDYSFAATLQKPAYLNGTVAMENKEDFYQRWADPSHSVCRIPATTESIYIIIEHPEMANLQIWQNGSIIYHSFTETVKLTFEIVRSGKIDSYGEYITTDPFENVDMDNLFNPNHPSRRYSPTFLYRVTAVNGIYLPQEAIATLNKASVLSDPDHFKSLRQIFACNRNYQLMFEDIPIINFHLI